MSEYNVHLDAYNGPLDLLLYLIRRDEIDIYDIPIARITQQYTEYCETLRQLDPNLAADFLVLAATLMEIKSRMLLPRPEAAPDDDLDLADPRNELVRQLLEYKRFKDASFNLAHAARLQAQRWPRAAPGLPPAAPGEIELEDLQVWDLVTAFNQLLAATGRGPVTHDVIVDDTPLALHAADVLDRLVRDGGSMPFSVLFLGRTRAEMIGLFLALLELIRQARVRATQSEAFGEIRLELLSAEPITIGPEWEPRSPAPADDAENPAAASVQPPDSHPAPLNLPADPALASDDDLHDPDAERILPELDDIRTEPRDVP